MVAADDDGRVTLAVIRNQIENIQEDVIEINGKVDACNENLNVLNIRTAVIEKGQKDFCDDIGDLQQKSNRNDIFVVIGNTIALAVASIANVIKRDL